MSKEGIIKKKEIIQKHLKGASYSMDGRIYGEINANDILKAMDEWAGYCIFQSKSITTEYEIPKYILDAYAKQEAIAFDKWKHDNKYVQRVGFDTPVFAKDNVIVAGKQVYFCSAELYNEYLKSKEGK